MTTSATMTRGTPLAPPYSQPAIVVDLQAITGTLIFNSCSGQTISDIGYTNPQSTTGRFTGNLKGLINTVLPASGSQTLYWQEVFSYGGFTDNPLVPALPILSQFTSDTTVNGITAGVITLAGSADLFNFGIGQVLQAYDSTNYSSALDPLPAFGYVITLGNTITTLAGTNGGTFTLTFTSQAGQNAQTTSAIAYNATAATVQTAIAALSNVGAGNVTVTGSAGGPYTIVFTKAIGPTGNLTSSVTGLSASQTTAAQALWGTVSATTVAAASWGSLTGLTLVINTISVSLTGLTTAAGLKSAIDTAAIPGITTAVSGTQVVITATGEALVLSGTGLGTSPGLQLTAGTTTALDGLTLVINTHSLSLTGTATATALKTLVDTATITGITTTITGTSLTITALNEALVLSGTGLGTTPGLQLTAGTTTPAISTATTITISATAGGLAGTPTNWASLSGDTMSLVDNASNSGPFVATYNASATPAFPQTSVIDLWVILSDGTQLKSGSGLTVASGGTTVIQVAPVLSGSDLSNDGNQGEV